MNNNDKSRGFPSPEKVYEFLHRFDGKRNGPREVINRPGPEGYTQVFEPWRWGDSDSDELDDLTKKKG